MVSRGTEDRNRGGIGNAQRTEERKPRGGAAKEQRAKALIDRLEDQNRLPREEWTFLLRQLREESGPLQKGSGPLQEGSGLPQEGPGLPDGSRSVFADLSPSPDSVSAYLTERARAVSRRTFGRKIYIRGLIEFSSFCRNDCYYCGIRAGNRHAERYRLTQEQILECCRTGYDLGFRTFVLQGGEDPGMDGMLTETIGRIREGFPDCAITLSAGERDRKTYERWKSAGANRYLLRHETADPAHYRSLHPKTLDPETRKRCLRDLKDLGYQIGAGFMVGSPGQTEEQLAEDFLYLEEMQPHMVGIGPFIPHHDTPFAQERPGSAAMTLRCVSLLRLMLPEALLPATTALGTIAAQGREQGILSGANVVMPNLSPLQVRTKYELYDNKLCTGEEAAECLGCLTRRMESIGYELTVSRGDHPRAAAGEQ